MSEDQRQMIAARKRSGLTQIEFAILFGVHPITISKWETGKSTPTAWQFHLADKIPIEKDLSKMLAGKGPISTLAYLLNKSFPR